MNEGIDDDADQASAYVEFRDERVAFFVRQLMRGKHSLSYRLRAETPGQFSVLPTKASAMYAPELKANSDEMKVKIANCIVVKRVSLAMLSASTRRTHWHSEISAARSLS